MRGLRLIFPALLLVTLAAVGGAYYVVSSRTGVSIVSAAPDTLVPATADVYISLNRGGDQGTALGHLWQVYQAHRGTAASVAHLRADLVKAGADPNKLNALLASLGDQAGLAIWLPPSGRTVNPRVAIVAQVKAMDLLTGNDPLAGNATTTPLWSYSGTQVYRVTFKGARRPAGYGCIISGDGVWASDPDTIKNVIDTAIGHGQALAGNKGYSVTMATLPSSRSVTAYVAASVAAMLQKQIVARSSVLPVSAQRAMVTIPVRPYGASVSASGDGLAFNSTALPIGTLAGASTDSKAADMLGSNTIMYSSQSDLAAALTPALDALPSATLAQTESQLGIDVHRDLLGWMNGEYAIALNDGSSPIAAQAANGIMARASGIASNAPAAATSLPGSLELAWHVDDTIAVQRSLDRIARAVSKATNSSSPLVSPAALPSGATGYTIMGLAGVGYAFRGHWLILSSNLTADAATPAKTLSADGAYAAALSHVGGSGGMAAVSYVDVDRLLGVVDRWIAYANRAGNGIVSHATGSVGWTWAQAEPLFSPARNVIVATRHVGRSDLRVDGFITVAS